MKISIHPLFLAVIVFCAFFGGFMVTMIFVLTALLHECGHIFCAARMGFRCEKIKLMPYGASAVCDVEGISVREEIRLALAGPLVNAVICVGCAGLWWFYPETYAFTDTVMLASAAMFAVNLLPAYPLDGGRVFRCLLVKLFSEKAASIVLRVVALLLAAAFIALFFMYGYNLTCLFFALFLLCSAAERAYPAVKIDFSTKKRLRRGAEVKYVMVDGNLTYTEAVKLLDDRKYLVLQLYDDGYRDEMTQDELYEGMLRHRGCDRVFEEGN